MLHLLWVIAILTLYVYLRKSYNKFSTLGVNQLPVVPMLGNLTPIILKREFIIDTFEKTIKAFPDDKVVGFYEFMTPVYFINDVELLKKITMRDFEHFTNRRSLPDVFQNTLFTKNLLALKGEEWKAMRHTLSPAFTGSKVRLMVPFMVEVAEQMINRLTNKINETKVEYLDIETKDMTARCTNDILASCVFGIQMNSTQGDNDFYTNCREASNLTSIEFVKFIFIRTFPTVARMLNFNLKPKLSKFFKEMMLEILTYREQNDVLRNDMMNILKEAKKEWQVDYLTAQAVLFLMAGFETVSTGLAFLLHELALHPEVQERLHQEIRKAHDSNNGICDYNTVQDMTYLDMVVSEGLRLWPPGLIAGRTCVKDYNIGRPNDKAKTDVIIRKGDGVQFSIWTFHRNPTFFPEPEKFDPERFSEKNKHKIKPFTYMPFGLGPRACIGSRFALIEIKVLLYMLLLNIEVAPCEKTRVPVVLAIKDVFPRIQGGHWVRMKLRTTT